MPPCRESFIRQFLGGPVRVEVYYNVHKDCLSYRQPGGRIQHAQAVTLENVRFSVQPAGRDRSRRLGKKTVHAYVRGELVGLDDRAQPIPGAQRVTYSPFRYDSFVDCETGAPVTSCQRVTIVGRLISADLAA